MLLGILSDTHDEYEWMKLAIKALEDRGAKVVVHCGDLCSARMLELFTVRPNETVAAFIFGNADDDLAAMEQRAKALGVTCLEDQGRVFEMAGKRFAVMHGDPGDPDDLDDLAASQQYDYVLCGHTHEWRDERVGRCRIINPGQAALLKDRNPTKPATCALLDVETDHLVRIPLS